MMKGVNLRFSATNAAAPVMRQFQRDLRGVQKTTQANAPLMRSWNAGLNSNRRAVQQLGFQMSDFAIQIAGGQSAMLAFTQQGGQMLQFFGPAGAIAAAFLAVFGSLAIAFIKSGRALSDLFPLVGVLQDDFRTLGNVLGTVKELLLDFTNLVVNNLDVILIAAGSVVVFFMTKWIIAFVNARSATLRSAAATAFWSSVTTAASRVTYGWAAALWAAGRSHAFYVMMMPTYIANMVAMMKSTAMFIALNLANVMLNIVAAMMPLTAIVAKATVAIGALAVRMAVFTATAIVSGVTSLTAAITGFSASAVIAAVRTAMWNAAMLPLRAAMTLFATLTGLATGAVTGFSLAAVVATARTVAFHAAVTVTRVVIGAYSIAMVAARVATLGVAVAMGTARAASILLIGTLKALKFAIVALGIGALVIGAGYLIERFMKLIEAAGGWGEALNVLKDVAKGAWDKIKAGWDVVYYSLRSSFNDLQFAFAKITGEMLVEWGRFADKVASTGLGEKLGLSGGNELKAIVDMNTALSGLTDEMASFQEASSAAQKVLDAPNPGMERLRELMASVKDDWVNVRDWSTPGNQIAEGASNAANAVNNELMPAINNELMPAMERLKSVQDTVSGAFERGMMAMVEGTKSVKDAFKAMAVEIIKELYRIFVVKQITGMVSGAIGGMFGGGGGGGGGVSLPSFDGGGFTWRGPRAGGIDGKGGRMAVLHPNETVTDHTKGGGTGMTVNINNTFAPGVSRAEFDAQMPKMIEATKAAVADAARRGGSYSKAFR